MIQNHLTPEHKSLAANLEASKARGANIISELTNAIASLELALFSIAEAGAHFLRISVGDSTILIRIEIPIESRINGGSIVTYLESKKKDEEPTEIPGIPCRFDSIGNVWIKESPSLANEFPFYYYAALTRLIIDKGSFKFRNGG